MNMERKMIKSRGRGGLSICTTCDGTDTECIQSTLQATLATIRLKCSRKKIKSEIPQKAELKSPVQVDDDSNLIVQ